jgi:hypothetical protein
MIISIRFVHVGVLASPRPLTLIGFGALSVLRDRDLGSVDLELIQVDLMIRYIVSIFFWQTEVSFGVAPHPEGPWRHQHHPVGNALTNTLRSHIVIGIDIAIGVVVGVRVAIDITIAVSVPIRAGEDALEITGLISFIACTPSAVVLSFAAPVTRAFDIDTRTSWCRS